MAWTITDWTANPDWAQLANIQDFVKAWNERRLILNDASMIVPAASWDVQAVTHSDGSAVGWYTIQNWIEDHYTSFVVSHAAGSPLGANYYDGEASINKYASFNAFMTAALGAGRTDWRRYTTHPDEAGSDLGGKMQTGDIIGPWIFEDIQKAFNALIWTGGSETWDRNGEQNAKAANKIDRPTWADAKSDAETEYNADSRTASTPRATSYGHQFVDFGFGAILDRAYMYLSPSGQPTFCRRAAEFYVKATKWVVWDASGDDVLEDLWSLFDEQDPSPDAASFLSAAAGDTGFSVPNWVPEPALGETLYRGWLTSSNGYMILRWEITDGFEYS